MPNYALEINAKKVVSAVCNETPFTADKISP